MSRAARAVIDLSALRHNLQQVRHAAPQQQIIAVVKADAYGHGIVAVARALADADVLGVACLEEALSLREAGIDKSILLLEGFFHVDELPLIQRHKLQIVVHDERQLDVLASLSPQTFSIPAWLKVDTGMHRLGIAPHAVPAVWQRLAACPAVAPRLGLMTHLANADDGDDGFTRKQLDCLASVRTDRSIPVSIANSAGILAWPAAHGDVVRPGIMLYGVSPMLGENGAQRNLRPVMTLYSELISIRQCKKGDAVGYGGNWVCPEDMPVGVVAMGYGDGYPRHAPSGTPLLVKGRRAALIGRVSMDMICVDLRGQPGAAIGDSVTLWGDGLPAEEIAGCASTIAYALLCGVTCRVKKETIDG